MLVTVWCASGCSGPACQVTGDLLWHVAGPFVSLLVVVVCGAQALWSEDVSHADPGNEADCR